MFSPVFLGTSCKAHPALEQDKRASRRVGHSGKWGYSRISSPLPPSLVLCGIATEPHLVSVSLPALIYRLLLKNRNTDMTSHLLVKEGIL